jgi:hypothetical protein
MDMEQDGDSPPDWEEVILEVQTDPAGSSSAALGVLFNLLHGYIETLARVWLRKHRSCEEVPGDLAATGWDTISSHISKFKIPDDGSAGIGRAFKAWVGTCCNRAWNRNFSERLEQTMAENELSQIAWAPSAEDLVTCTDEPTDGQPRSDPTAQFGSRLLQEELGKLIEPMRDAILETEDHKSLLSPAARGKTGQSAAIAAKYGFTQNAIRTARSRVVQRVKERFAKEFSHD